MPPVFLPSQLSSTLGVNSNQRKNKRGGKKPCMQACSCAAGVMVMYTTNVRRAVGGNTLRTAAASCPLSFSLSLSFLSPEGIDGRVHTHTHTHTKTASGRIGNEQKRKRKEIKIPNDRRDPREEEIRYPFLYMRVICVRWFSSDAHAHTRKPPPPPPPPDRQQH